MAKYDPLKDYLVGVVQAEIPLTFQEFEQIIGAKLPASARMYREWWWNDPSPGSSSRHCKAWLDAGFKVQSIDFVRERVVFARGSR